MTPETFDTWFPRLARAVSFLVGLAIAGWETIVDHADRPYLLLFAAGLLGVQLSSSAEKLAAKVLSNVAPAPPTDGPAVQPLVVKADTTQGPEQPR